MMGVRLQGFQNHFIVISGVVADEAQTIDNTNFQVLDPYPDPEGSKVGKKIFCTFDEFIGVYDKIQCCITRK
jgi:hypothetical protein